MLGVLVDVVRKVLLRLQRWPRRRSPSRSALPRCRASRSTRCRFASRSLASASGLSAIGLNCLPKDGLGSRQGRGRSRARRAKSWAAFSAGGAEGALSPAAPFGKSACLRACRCCSLNRKKCELARARPASLSDSWRSGTPHIDEAGATCCTRAAILIWFFLWKRCR